MFRSHLTALLVWGALAGLAACSTTTAPTQPPPPPPITLAAVLTDTSYAGGLAHLRVAFSTSAPATVDLRASDGTLTSTGPTTYDWAVSPQTPSHALYGCAVASGPCTPDTTVALLAVGQLPHDPSLLVTSTVASGYVHVIWHSFLGDTGDTVLSSPIPSPGACYRFTTAPGDSIAWVVVANDSAWTQGTSATTSLMPASGWRSADSLPAWYVHVRASADNPPGIVIDTVPGGVPC